MAPQLLTEELFRQSSLVAFVDVFWLVTWSFVVMAPLVLLMSRPLSQRDGTRSAAFR